MLGVSLPLPPSARVESWLADIATRITRAHAMGDGATLGGLEDARRVLDASGSALRDVCSGIATDDQAPRLNLNVEIIVGSRCPLLVGSVGGLNDATAWQPPQTPPPRSASTAAQKAPPPLPSRGWSSVTDRLEEALAGLAM